jgi:hypothetical protein
MFQLTIQVTTLDELLEVGAHLQALPFLDFNDPNIPTPAPTPAAAQPAPPPAERESKPTNGSAYPETGTQPFQPATDNQWNFLMDLAERNGWERDDFEIALMDYYSVGSTTEISKKIASDTITALQNGEFKPLMKG